MGINFDQIRVTLTAVAVIVVIVVGIIALAKSRSGEIRESGKVLLGVLIGAFIIGLGVNIIEIGTWLVNLIMGK